MYKYDYFGALTDGTPSIQTGFNHDRTKYKEASREVIEQGATKEERAQGRIENAP
jgi:hypothetical protein